jgi:hypothetical protein
MADIKCYKISVIDHSEDQVNEPTFIALHDMLNENLPELEIELVNFEELP